MESVVAGGAEPLRIFDSARSKIGRETRRHLPSIRRVLAVWVKDDARVKALATDPAVTEPFVGYFRYAPKSRDIPERPKGRVKPLEARADEKDVQGHLVDEGVGTTIGPCIAKVILSLGYTRGDLYSLQKKHIFALEIAIKKTRAHLGVQIPRTVSLTSEKEENRKSGFDSK